MRYVKDLRGLGPSEYAGGGSASSSLLLLREDSPFVSCGRARLVSSWNLKAAAASLEEDSGFTESAGA